jgi:hypothetical protein
MERRNMQAGRVIAERRGDLARPDPGAPRLSRSLDRGFGEARPRDQLFHATRAGVVLPSNSPGVHGLWVPAIAMKIPLVLRPGSAEAMDTVPARAGVMRRGDSSRRRSVISPATTRRRRDRRQTGRSMFFGDIAAVGLGCGDPRVDCTGPATARSCSRRSPGVVARLTSI